jgi:hypothetical protein
MIEIGPRVLQQDVAMVAEPLPLPAPMPQRLSPPCPLLQTVNPVAPKPCQHDARHAYGLHSARSSPATIAQGVCALGERAGQVEALGGKTPMAVVCDGHGTIPLRSFNSQPPAIGEAAIRTDVDMGIGVDISRLASHGHTYVHLSPPTGCRTFLGPKGPLRAGGKCAPRGLPRVYAGHLPACDDPRDPTEHP